MIDALNGVRDEVASDNSAKSVRIDWVTVGLTGGAVTRLPRREIAILVGGVTVALAVKMTGVGINTLTEACIIVVLAALIALEMVVLVSCVVGLRTGAMIGLLAVTVSSVVVNISVEL